MLSCPLLLWFCFLQAHIRICLTFTGFALPMTLLSLWICPIVRLLIICAVLIMKGLCYMKHMLFSRSFDHSTFEMMLCLIRSYSCPRPYWHMKVSSSLRAFISKSFLYVKQLWGFISATQDLVYCTHVKMQEDLGSMTEYPCTVNQQELAFIRPLPVYILEGYKLYGSFKVCRRRKAMQALLRLLKNGQELHNTFQAKTL